MRKYITTIILVVIFLGLLAFFWFYESKKGPTGPGSVSPVGEEELQTKTFTVWDLNRDEIISLVIERDDKLIYINKEPDGSFKILKPTEAKAKTDKINEILDKLIKTEGQGEKIPYQNLDDFGLGKPKVKATIRFRDGSARDIIFGDKNPEGVKVYAKVSDKDFVFLIGEDLFNKVNVNEEDLKE
jgi:hypothetical protein